MVIFRTWVKFSKAHHFWVSVWLVFRDFTLLKFQPVFVDPFSALNAWTTVGPYITRLPKNVVARRTSHLQCGPQADRYTWSGMGSRVASTNGRKSMGSWGYDPYMRDGDMQKLAKHEVWNERSTNSRRTIVCQYVHQILLASKRIYNPTYNWRGPLCGCWMMMYVCFVSLGPLQVIMANEGLCGSCTKNVKILVVIAGKGDNPMYVYLSWFKIFVIFVPTCGNDPIWLYNMFQTGWKHRL